MADGRDEWLKTLADLPEDPGSIPGTHMATHNHLLTPVLGVLFWSPLISGTHDADIYARKTHLCTK